MMLAAFFLAALVLNTAMLVTLMRHSLVTARRLEKIEASIDVLFDVGQSLYRSHTASSTSRAAAATADAETQKPEV